MCPQSKYDTLVNILDVLRDEAPPEFKSYHVLQTETDKLNSARSRAFIHLYLKVKYGILDFKEREHYVTDQPNDGGIDAYYISEDTKTVCFVQSKFRTTENGFEEKRIRLDEILQMDVDRIVEGQSTDELGHAYNGKIHQLQREIASIPDIGRYKYKVVVLANLRNVSQNDLRRLTGGFSAEVFDYEGTYRELLFPVICGTYYTESELCIALLSIAARCLPPMMRLRN